MPARSKSPPRWRSPSSPVRVGISSCLLGREVRYDGGHKRDAFVQAELGPFVEWVPVCPEVEMGMGVPRPAIRILQPETTEGVDAQRLVEVDSGRDHTPAMRRFARRRVRELGAESLCGFVLKKDSPTCGVERVKVWPSSGPPARDGRGFFARALMDRHPLLPVEDEGRLRDPAVRENFVERIFAYHRLCSLYAERFGAGSLMAFHRAHEIQLRAHSQRHFRELWRLVDGLRGRPASAERIAYAEGFMRALGQRATPRRHYDVLRHMLGRFRKRLDDASRRELNDVIEDYRAGRVPLIVAVALVRHHVRRLEVDSLADQVYLDPHPGELMLRKGV